MNILVTNMSENKNEKAVSPAGSAGKQLFYHLIIYVGIRDQKSMRPLFLEYITTPVPRTAASANAIATYMTAGSPV